MARRTKTQLVEFEVETALEKALNVDFDEDILLGNDFGTDSNVIEFDTENDSIDLEDLAKQIEQATAENTAAVQKAASAVVDKSVAEQLFKKPSTGSSSTKNSTSKPNITPAGTVKKPVLTDVFQPANDDSGRSRVNKSIMKTSFTRIYMSTTALSAFWALGGLTFANKLSGGLTSMQNIGHFFASPTGLSVVAGTVLPIAMFWGFAQLAKRAKELQGVVRAISDVASRLIEPDAESEARIVQIGQTVRHEVSLMGDGLERTISRAVELEALVQGEVQNLERAYTENENRIHNLIKELNAEREAILGHADRVKSTIRSSQDQIADEFNLIATDIASNVQKITSSLTDTVKENGDVLVKRINSAGEDLAQKVSAQVDERTLDLTESLGRSTETALQNFEDKFNILDGKIVERANQSVVDFDGRIGTLVDRAGSISTAFDTATEQAIHAFEGRLSKMDSMLGERSNSIIHSFIARAQSLETNTEKLGEVLEERVSYINATLKDRTEEIAKTFESGYSQVNSVLKQRVNDIAAVFNGGNNEINATLHKHIEEISKSVGSNYQQLNTILEQRVGEITSAFSGGNEELSLALTEHASNVSKTFDVGYEKISGSMQECSTELTKAFDGKNKVVVDDLKSRVVEIEQIFENGFNYIDNTMNERIKDITQNIVGTQGVIDDALKMRLTEIVDTFGRNRNEISDTMRERVFEISRAFESGHNDISTTLKDYSLEISQALEGERFNISALMENMTSNLNNEVDKIDESVSRALDKRADDFRNHLDEGRLLIEQALQNGGDGITNSVQDQMATISSHLNDIEKTLLKNIQQVDSFAIEHGETLGARTLELTNTIEHSVSAAREVLDTQARNIDVRADALRDSLTLNNSALNEVLAEQAHILEERIDGIRGLLSRSDLNFSEVVNFQIQAVETAVAENSDVLKASFSEHLQSLASHTELIRSALADTGLLHASLDESSDKIQHSFEAQNAAIDERTSAIQIALESGAEYLRSSLENSTAKVSENINVRVATAIDDFTNKMQGASVAADEIGTKFEQTITSFQDKIDLVTVGVSDKILDSSERIIVIGAEASKMVEEAAASMESKLADRSLFLSSAAQQVELNVDDRLNDIGQRLSMITNDHIGQFSEHIEQITDVSEKLMSAAAKTGQSFGALSGEFANRLNETTFNAQEEMRRGNDELTEAFAKRISETIATINSVEGDVNESIGGILNNVNALLLQLNQSVKNIQYSSNDLLTGIEEMDSKFSATAQIFYENVDTVRENMAHSSDVLVANVENLRSLSHSAIGQMEDMGQHFTAHSSLLEQAASILDNSQHNFTSTVENRQQALHVLSTGLASKSDEVAAVIKRYSDMLMTMMEDTQNKSKQSAFNMQKELAKLVEQASEKFETATAEIRRNADEVRNELSLVSSDISHTVRALPEQTRQSTDAMRGAISDQISALKELTGLMNQSSSLSDVSQAMALPEEAFTYNKTEREMPRSTSAQTILETGNDHQEKKNSGWVSELLARASRDEQGTSVDMAPVATKTRNHAKELATEVNAVENMVESLNSMSQDIVQAIDHNALVELWSHYRRGRRNIFIQRLYTMSGQKTFRKIKDKYIQDREFRSSVNQYISDFERLLRDIQSNEGKESVHDYLTSDTGKVYTMLAHSSGRIE